MFFTRGGRASYLPACLGARLLPQSYQYPNLSEGADNVGGQLQGDKDRVPLQWRNCFWQSLEEGAGKRCSEFGLDSEVRTETVFDPALFSCRDEIDVLY